MDEYPGFGKYKLAFYKTHAKIVLLFENQSFIIPKAENT